MKNENINFCINVNYFFYCMKSQLGLSITFKNEQKKPDTTIESQKNIIGHIIPLLLVANFRNQLYWE